MCQVLESCIEYSNQVPIVKYSSIVTLPYYVMHSVHNSNSNASFSLRNHKTCALRIRPSYANEEMKVCGRFDMDAMQ